MASLEQAVVENLHRADLNAMEEAAAYQQLIEEFDLTHEQVAARVGKSRVAVTNSLRLFQLPADAPAHGGRRPAHRRACQGAPRHPRPRLQEHLAKRAVAEGLTVRDVEDAVRERAELEGGAAPGGDDADAADGPKPRAVRSPNRDPGLLELEELLAEFLDTRVAIKAGRGRGKLTVEFADLEDLERIYRLIARGTGRC